MRKWSGDRILGLEPGVDFKAIKKAYYNRAKGLLNEAGATPAVPFPKSDKYSIMDTPADDILEEIIVNNNPPRDTTLATLMADLKKTDVFITFREGK